LICFTVVVIWFSAAIAGIASKANNSSILMALLSFAITIAPLLMAINIYQERCDEPERESSLNELLNLFAIKLYSYSPRIYPLPLYLAQLMPLTEFMMRSFNSF
jgi:hypothetical protein